MTPDPNVAIVTNPAIATPKGMPTLLGKSLMAGWLTLMVSVALLIQTGAWEEIEFTYFFAESLDPHNLVPWLWGMVASTALLKFLVLGWRVWLVGTYRPTPPCAESELPSCTVVVPAYNEGSQVRETIHSIAASDYPARKLQIIAVDDGSVDDTWKWMELAAAELPGRVKLVRLARNQGKREALHQGIKKAKGEVLVTIDSDSLVDPQTLNHLVAPFVADPSVGAVAGNVRVLNQRQGIIPRMLDVNFTYSFDFIRASQSRVNTVMCTPGALSAYRRSVVMRVLPRWLRQRFLGQPAKIGEDRAMTNLILSSGYHVVFQREALVYTKVPVRYGGLCKMFLRWARSNVRETLVMTSFAFTRFRKTPAKGARVNLLLGWFSLTAGEVFKVIGLAYLVASPLIYGPYLLMGAATASLVPCLVYALRYRKSDCLWAVPYSIFWVLGMSWISLYALFTARRSSWLTRQLKQVAPPQDGVMAPLPAQAAANTGGVRR